MVNYHDRRKIGIQERLRNVEFFKELTEEEIFELFSIANDTFYPKDSTISIGERVPKELIVTSHGSIEVFLL